MTPADVAFLDPGRGRGSAGRLGLAVALATLPWLGFVPDEVRAAPAAAVTRLAERLELDPAVLEGYGQRAHTRSDHLRLAAGYLGWKSAPAGSAAVKDLEQAERERTWALVSARAKGISIRTLAAAIGLSPSRVHEMVADAGLVSAPGQTLASPAGPTPRYCRFPAYSGRTRTMIANRQGRQLSRFVATSDWALQPRVSIRSCVRRW